MQANNLNDQKSSTVKRTRREQNNELLVPKSEAAVPSMNSFRHLQSYGFVIQKNSFQRMDNEMSNSACMTESHVSSTARNDVIENLSSTASNLENLTNNLILKQSEWGKGPGI